MKRMHGLLLVFTLLAAGNARTACADYIYKTLDDHDPLSAGNGTVATGIDGNNIVGTYDGRHGFLYNSGSYTPIADTLGYATQANGISGANIVGSYFEGGHMVGNQHGFQYNAGTYTTLDDPNAVPVTTAFTGPWPVLVSQASGISGNNIVGTYYDGTGQHSYLYDGSSYTTIDHPLGANGTYAQGISGNDIVGYYYDGLGNQHGFLAATSLVASVTGGQGYGTAGLSGMTADSLPTTVSIMAGAASTNETVSITPLSGAQTSSFALANGQSRYSDIVQVSGTGHDTYVMEMSYDPTTLLNGFNPADLYLGWWDGNNWVNAIAGNTGHSVNQFFNSAYDPSLFTLGYWGVDTADNYVWAVIDHNSPFGVLDGYGPASPATAVPEPATAGLWLVGGLVLLALRRKMKGGNSSARAT